MKTVPEKLSRSINGCLLSFAVFLGTGCQETDLPRVVLAEFQDDVTPDGEAWPDESILLVLDRPLPEDLSPDGVQITSVPPAAWTTEIQATDDPRVLRVRIVTGTPAFRFQGVHGEEPESSGLRIELGRGLEQVVDLQIRQSLPVLERVVWVDYGDSGGNLVVDQGDFLRLIFDRPVRLILPAGGTLRVRCPQDIILSKTTDRLDDGRVQARLEPGDSPKEVRLVLGSRPLLTVAGRLGESGQGIERFQPGSPSGLALNGTPVLPMAKITDRRQGPGAISLKEVDVEYEKGFPLPRRAAGSGFPPPGNRLFHSLNAVVGSRAIIAGGAMADGWQAIDQVLIFDPFRDRESGEGPFTIVPGRLPHPVYNHTATSLPGPDGLVDTEDDVILVVGGTDGSSARGELTLLRLQNDGGVDVVPLATRLRVPRTEHAALALPGNRVLVDGGQSYGTESPAGLVGCAEIIEIAFERNSVRIASHVSFRSIARKAHTLSVLPPTSLGKSLVLAYGGYGQALKQYADPLLLGHSIGEGTPRDCFFPTENGSVLVSPVLLDLSAPVVSFLPLDYDFSFSLLRWGHTALSVEPGIGERTDPPGAVLLLGGTLRYSEGRSRFGPALWEMPLSVLPDMPQGPEAANALLFRFDPEDPSRSRFEILPHPSADPGRAPERVAFAAVKVPSLGVLLTGGEPYGDSGKTEGHSSIEVLLEESGNLAKLAVRMRTGRSGHRAHYVGGGGDTRLVFLIGGIPGGKDTTDFAQVEEIPLGP